MRKRVLVSCIHLQRRMADFAEEFDIRGIEVECPQVDQQLSEEWLLENAGRFDGVIAGDDPFSEGVLNRGHEGRLRVLIKWGIGVDAIDLAAAGRLGIRVENTPGMFSDEVADVALGYVVMLARELHAIHLSVAGGEWYKPVGETLRGKTLGIVGLGSIGRGVADRARGFGFELIGSDPAPPPTLPSWLRVVPWGDLCAESDYIVLCCNLSESNRHLVNEEALGRMKRGVRIINVARGPLVDEGALVRALDSGKVRAAALDVFEEEPLPSDSPLRGYPQCVWGSHNGSNTREAVDRVNRVAVDRLFALLESDG